MKLKCVHGHYGKDGTRIKPGTVKTVKTREDRAVMIASGNWVQDTSAPKPNAPAKPALSGK